jgi:hypothetical protein
VPLSEDDVAELYSVPREEFLPARQRLVKRLRSEDDREAAAAAGALRKPTVAAWAVNQLARERREDIEGLIEVGRTVGRLQRKGPRSQDELREATRDRRRRIDELTQAAEELLSNAGAGSSRATLDAVAGTLEAAVRDESAREQVLRGALDKELEPPVGFGDLSALRLVPAEEPEAPEEGAEAEPEAAAEPAADSADEARLARARKRAEQLAETAEELEEEAARRRQEAADRVRVAVKTRDAADRAEREAQQAEKEADLARKAADKAERKAIEARERADRTAREAGA